MEALIVDDVLNDFVYGKLKSPKALRIIAATKRLILSARRRGIPVVYACDAHLENDPEIKLWGAHAMKGTKGSLVIDELKPTPKDFVLEKRVYSSFHETGLDLLLRDLGVDSVVIAGLYTDICVRHSAADAFQRGFKVVIPSDCVEALNEDNDSGLDYLRRIYNAEITTSSELEKRWKARRRSASPRKLYAG
jgi:nicotinamidase-related amidase